MQLVAGLILPSLAEKKTLVCLIQYKDGLYSCKSLGKAGLVRNASDDAGLEN